MKALLLGGPNQGVHDISPSIDNVLKLVDPTEPALYKIADGGSSYSIKTNTYYRISLHPYAYTAGIESMFRFSHSNH